MYKITWCGKKRNFQSILTWKKTKCYKYRSTTKKAKADKFSHDYCHYGEKLKIHIFKVYDKKITSKTNILFIEV